MSDNFDELPKRVEGLLKDEGFDKKEDIILAYDHELLNISGIGKKSLKTIRKVCGPGILNRNIYEQCELLDIRVCEFTIVEKEGKWLCPIERKFTSVEKAVLNHIRKDGWTGVDWEGSPIHILIDAASLEYRWKESGQSSYSIESEKSEYITITSQIGRDKHIGYWEWKNTFNRTLNELIEPSANIDDRTMKESIDYYLRLNYEHIVDHDIFSFLFNLWKSFGKEKFRKILEIMLNSDTYSYPSGWPDLSLVKGSKHLFVEVKTLSDKLHASQIRTYKSFGSQLSLPWKVAIVKPEGAS